MLKTIISGTIAAAFACFSAPVIASGSMLSSWYGAYFHGRLTANGERYNMHGLTAAHKTLPFGTKLRVCYRGHHGGTTEYAAHASEKKKNI